MANSIKASCSIEVTNNGNRVFGEGSFEKEMAGSKISTATQYFAFEQVDAINMGGISSPANVLIRNLDDQSNLYIFTDALGVDIISIIQPGEFIVLTYPPTLLYGSSSADSLPDVLALIVSAQT